MLQARSVPVPSDGFEPVPMPKAIAAADHGQPKSGTTVSKPPQAAAAPPLPPVAQITPTQRDDGGLEQITKQPISPPDVPSPNRPTRCIWNCFFVIFAFLCLVYYKIRNMYYSL